VTWFLFLTNFPVEEKNMKPKIRSLLKVLPGLILGLVFIGQVSPASGFRITKIEYPGAVHTHVQGLNDNGVVVGWYSGQLQIIKTGFKYDGVGFTPLTYPGASSTAAYGINNNGKIVGSYVLGGVTNGFVYDGVNYASLTYPGATSTIAYGINDADEIVGAYTNAEGTYGFFYDGEYGTFAPILKASASYLYGINNKGWLVGSYTLEGVTHGFKYDPVHLLTPLDVPGATQTEARGISIIIVGDYLDPITGLNGFIYNGSSYTKIRIPGSDNTSLTTVNIHGRAGGTYVTHSPPPEIIAFSHGFLLDQGDVTPLISLLLLD
jgi:uncharacterized membrane protein